MKRLFTTLLLSAALLFAYTAKAAIFINNNSTCPVVFVFYAHDANNMPACSYYSTRLTVPAGSSSAYNNVTNLNSPGLGWYLPGFGSAMLVAAQSGWDAVQIFSTDPNGPQTIGQAGTCATGTNYTTTAASCNFTANWIDLGNGNIMIDIM